MRTKGRSVVPRVDRSPGGDFHCPKSACSTIKRDRRTWKGAMFLFACLVFAQGPRALSGQETRRVLGLYEQGLASSAVALVDREIRDVLQRQSSYHIEFYTEYMDTNLFPDSASQRNFRKWYIQKYQDRQPDVIIAAGPTPIQFMIGSHNKYFHDVPVVICCSFQAPTDDVKRDSRNLPAHGWSQIQQKRSMVLCSSSPISNGLLSSTALCSSTGKWKM
jgi:hypothetical protein